MAGKKRNLPIPHEATEFSITGGVLVLSEELEITEDESDNADYSLDHDIKELLSKPKKDEKSCLEQKIENTKARKFVNKMVQKTTIAKEFKAQDITLRGRLSGVQFTLPNPVGYTTVLYEVYCKYDFPTKTRYLAVEEMECVQEDDKSFATWFWDYPDPRCMVVILSFDATSGEVFINNGIIQENQIKVTKTPTLFRFENWYLPSAPDLNASAYDIENMKENACKQILETAPPQEAEWVDTDLDKAPAIIIDPDTAKPVLREVYYDEENQSLKARIKLVPYKGYFVFQIHDAEADSSVIPLTDIELGYLYQSGSHGFPKDPMLAIRHFEKDGSPEAMYQIAGIFHTEKELMDEELYMEYLQKAAEQGTENAIAELAEHYCMAGGETALSRSKELFRKVTGEDHALGNFFFAACLERGLLGDVSPEDIFEAYYTAASREYAPALARLHCTYSDLADREGVYAYFQRTLEQGESNLEYCLGAVRYFGYGMARQKENGLRLLRNAGANGDVQAIFTLVDDIDPEDRNDEEALQWLLRLEESGSLDDFDKVRLASCLMDGKGCVCSVENDFLAVSILKRAADSGNHTAMNNLGWMYKNGRGCSADYAKAKELFEKAGTASSYYHLGDMYERGLGVTADLEKALELYKTASRRGNKKAKKRLEEIQKAQETHHKNDPIPPKPSDEQGPEQTLQSLLEHVTDIHDQVTQINSRTSKMGLQLDALVMFVETDLKTVLLHEKKQLQERASVDDDYAVSSFVKKAVEYINAKTKSVNDLAMQEEAHLKSMFGSHWSRLHESSQTSLISAGVLWKSCAGISRTDFDFSGVCISAAAALETELKRVFFTGFQKFMQEKYGMPDVNRWEETFQNWPEKLLSMSKADFEAYCEMHSSNPKSKHLPKLELADMFTMGLLPYIFGQPEQERSIEQENLLRKRLSEYLATIVLEKYKENPIAAFYKAGKNASFVGKCETVRRNYRNKAAHTDIVSRDQAANCYQQVVGKIDAFEYSSDITGLLIELFDKLKDI